MLQNLDRLKAFHFVYTTGSIVGAAARLHVSQSAISQSIRKLEQEVNTPLFTRLHKQLIPTTAGKRLNEIVHPFLTTLDIYLKELECAKDYPSGELNIGAPPEFGKAYLPAIISEFRERYPDVTFTLKLGAPEKLMPEIRKGTIDFALLDIFLTESTHIGHLETFHFTPVVEEEVILACSDSYYDEFIQGDHSYPTLIQQNFISYKEDQQAIRNWFKHHFSKQHINIRDVLTVDSHETVIMAIRNNIGLGIVSAHLIGKHLKNGAIRHITTEKNEIINSISLVKLQDKVPTHTEKIFENFLVSSIERMVTLHRSGMKIHAQ